MRLKAHLRRQSNDGTCLFTDNERQATVFLHSDQFKALGEPQVLIITLEEEKHEGD